MIIILDHNPPNCEPSRHLSPPSFSSARALHPRPSCRSALATSLLPSDLSRFRARNRPTRLLCSSRDPEANQGKGPLERRSLHLCWLAQPSDFRAAERKPGFETDGSVGRSIETPTCQLHDSFRLGGLGKPVRKFSRQFVRSTIPDNSQQFLTNSPSTMGCWEIPKVNSGQILCHLISNGYGLVFILIRLLHWFVFRDLGLGGSTD